MNISDKQVAEQLNKEIYTDDELVEITVPLNMPYFVTQNEYERHDGSVELNGTQYNYVKRKVKNDTLYLLCIPNRQKTQLYNAKNEYAKTVSDVPAGKKQTETPMKKTGFFGEYNIQTLQYNFIASGISYKKSLLYNNTLIADGFIVLPGKPPQAEV